MKEGKEEKKPFGISIDMGRTKLEHSIRMPINMIEATRKLKEALLKLKKIKK